MEKQKRIPCEARCDMPLGDDAALLQKAMRKRQELSGAAGDAAIESADTSPSTTTSTIDDAKCITAVKSSSTAARPEAPDLFIGIPEIFSSDDDMRARHPLKDFMPEVTNARLMLIGESATRFPRCIVHVSENPYSLQLPTSNPIATIIRREHLSDSLARTRVRQCIAEANERFVNGRRVDGDMARQVILRALEAVMRELVVDDTDFQSQIIRELHQEPPYFFQLRRRLPSTFRCLNSERTDENSQRVGLFYAK